MKIKFVRVLVAVVIMCGGVGLSPQMSRAEDLMQLSTNLDIEFAFYKTANSKPNFDALSAMISEEYVQDLGPENKIRHLKQTKAQLEAEFYSIKPGQDGLIAIEIPAQLEFINMEESARNPLQPSYISIFFEDDSKTPPFMIKTLSDLKVNLIVSNIENFLTIEFNDMERKNLSSRYPYAKNSKKTAMLPIRLRMKLKPLRVDDGGPINVKGQEVWLMLNEMAEMQILTMEDDSLIWTERAPWYEKKSLDKIMRLYKE